MSWSLSTTGRAGTLAGRLADDFKNTQGAPTGSAEEQAKNDLGEIASILCAGIADADTVVSIDANGSAWNEGGKMRSVYTKFEIKTVSNFVG